MTASTSDGWKQSAAYLEQAASLPDFLRTADEQLVGEYRFYAFMHHSHPFASYRVLAELVRSGWKPSRKPVEVDNG